MPGVNAGHGAPQPSLLVVVALGATALRALSADAGPVGKSRGETLRTDEGLPLVATWHPSALLRARDEDMAMMRAEFVQDLRRAATIAAVTIV